MKELKEIYRKRKQQLLPLAFTFASFFVIFRIIIPQWTDISDVSLLMTQKQLTVDAKEESIRLLNSIPTEKVESDYSLITTALPVQKDIILIFSQLSDAAARSNVKLGGFSVKVGGIYSSDKSEKQDIQKTVEGIPYLNILVNVSGQTDGLKRFADELYKSLPLVEIASINIGKTDARYDVNFYFKPTVLRPANADTTALKSMTPVENEQLEELRTWSSSAFPSQ